MYIQSKISEITESPILSCKLAKSFKCSKNYLEDKLAEKHKGSDSSLDTNDSYSNYINMTEYLIKKEFKEEIISEKITSIVNGKILNESSR